MGDEQRRPGTGGQGGAGGDQDGTPARGDADRTRPVPAPDTPGAEETQQWSPGADADRPWSPGPDRTVPSGGDLGQTPVNESPGMARWSGRAGVPPRVDRPPPGQVWYEEPPPRRWLVPVLIVLILVLLLILLGVGLWQAVNPAGNRAPAPAPTSSSESSPTPSTSPSPAPSPTPPSPTGPTIVAVPPVEGLSLTDAQSLLDAVGLKYVVTARPDPGVPAGTVLSSDPAPGSEVPVGTRLTLVVAATPAPTPSTTPTAGPGGTPPGRR